MLMRLSNACCTFSGSVTLSTVKLSSAKPSAANAGCNFSTIACDSSTWLAAISKNGMFDVPNAAAICVITVLRNCVSKSLPE